MLKRSGSELVSYCKKFTPLIIKQLTEQKGVKMIKQQKDMTTSKAHGSGNVDFANVVYLTCKIHLAKPTKA